MNTTASTRLARLSELFLAYAPWIAAVTLAVALVPRWIEASSTYINPDEAYYFAMGVADDPVETFWRSNRTHHPPLLPMLIHLTTRLTLSELSLRIFPLVAGLLLAWFAYRWLELVWGRTAGYIGLFLLAFSPTLISLSAQSRAYTLSILGAAVSLYWVERALRERSVRAMAGAAGGLYCAILSEYNAAFFAAAVGIYFLLRARTEKPSGAVWKAWAATQAGGILLYVLLVFTHVLPAATYLSPVGATGYLRSGFVQPGDNWIVFVVLGAAKQAAYVVSSHSVGALLLAFCATTLWVIFRRLPEVERVRAAPTLALPIVAVLAAAGGAAAGVHPLMFSRHASIVGFLIVLTAAPGAAYLMRGREWLVLPCLLAAVPVWASIARPDPNNIASFRHQRASMVNAAEFICGELSRGSWVLTEQEVWRPLRYYVHRAGCVAGADPETSEDPFRLHQASDYRFSDAAHLRESLKILVDENGLSGQDVWVVDGGWELLDDASDELGANVLARHDFGGAARILRVRVPLPASDSEPRTE